MPSLVRFVALLFAIASLSAPAAAQSAGKKYALLVGVETYDEKIFHRLNFAEEDVLEMGETLETLGFDVIVMTRHNEMHDRRPNTTQEINDQLSRRLRGLRKEDTLVVVFSGHGVQFKDDKPLDDGSRETWFCPEEADLRDRSSLVPLSEIRGRMAACAAGRKLLIVDACRNQVLSNLDKGAAQEIELEPAGVGPRTVPEGMLVLFSCASGEKSYEHSELKHGVFCYHVLKYLNGEADPHYYARDQRSVVGLANYA